MVRLEILKSSLYKLYPTRFTFQYGQIRNLYLADNQDEDKRIYIPVWLDQKYTEQKSFAY